MTYIILVKYWNFSNTISLYHKFIHITYIITSCFYHEKLNITYVEIHVSNFCNEFHQINHHCLNTFNADFNPNYRISWTNFWQHLRKFLNDQQYHDPLSSLIWRKNHKWTKDVRSAWVTQILKSCVTDGVLYRLWKHDILKHKRLEEVNLFDEKLQKTN